MNVLRVGVIGLGMGGGHVKRFQEHPGAKVVAVADTDPIRLEEKAQAFGVEKRYTRGEEMIQEEKLDLVCVATPNKFHKPLTIAALEAGSHVLCEKPMAMNAQEAREMLEAARKAGRRLMINFSFRFNPHSLQMKREVESGTLGDIYYARTIWLRRLGLPKFGGWFGQKALSGGGPLIDLGVHRLDLALWMMGYPKPVQVMARTYNHISKAMAEQEKKLFDVEDFAVALVTFANGATLELEASWTGHIQEKELMETRLMGTLGGMVHRNLNGGYEFETELFYRKNGCQYNVRPVPTATGKENAMAHFTDAILNDTPHMATGEEGLIVMQLLDAIYQSAERGEPVKI